MKFLINEILPPEEKIDNSFVQGTSYLGIKMYQKKVADKYSMKFSLKFNAVSHFLKYHSDGIFLKL